MNNDQQQFDLAVAGGGVAGLTAAAFAARAGLRVVLFERSERIGGRAISVRDGDYTFNLGPHALYDGHFRRALRELDVPFSGTVPSGLLVERRGRYHRLPASPGAILTTRLFSLRDRVEFVRALMQFSKPKPETVERMARTTMREWLDANLKREAPRLAGEGLFRLATYTHAPELVSMDLILAQVEANPVLYLHGGWQTLSDGLRDAALRSGVRVRSQTRVEQVSPSAGGYTVTALGGESVQARTVLLAIEPEVAAKVVQGPARSALRRWADQAIPVHSASLDIALDRLPNPTRPWALSLETPHYVAAHSSFAKLAPGEGASIAASRYLAPGEDGSSAEQELEALLDRQQPGWRDLVVHRRFMPSLVVAHDVPKAANGGLQGRPGPEVPNAPGLFVAGDWVGPEGWLSDASAASARAAAELAAAFLRNAGARPPVSIVA